MNWLQKFYFYRLKDKINAKLDENNQGQKQQLNKNSMLIGVILFDEQMATLKQKLKNQLIATGIFYDYLQSDYINLNQIQIRSVALHSSLLEVEQTIINLFQINPYNIDLQYLTSIFVQVLDIQNRKVSNFQQHALSLVKQKASIHKNYSQLLGQNDFFDENSCMVYCSLIDSNYKINKVSAKFQSIFKYSNNQVTGKPLSIILPRIIKETHSEIIDYCIKYNPIKLQQQRERFSFGVDEKGFVFPLTIKLKFDHLEDDFGVCALIQKIKQKKQYILFTDDGTITDFSKKIFVDLFQTTKFNQQEIHSYEKEEDEAKKIQIINEINKMKIIDQKKNNNSFLNYEDKDKIKIQEYNLEDSQEQINLFYNNFQRNNKKETSKFSLIQLQNIESCTIDLSSTKNAYESQRLFDQNNSRSDFQENFQSVFANLSDRNFCSQNNLESPKKLNILQTYHRKNADKQNTFENKQIPDRIDMTQKQNYSGTDKTQIQTLFNCLEDNSSFMNSNNQDRLNQSSNKQKLKRRNQSEDENLKEDQINEIASVNSSKFSSQELIKRQIIKKIKNNKLNGGQNVMIYLGVISFLVLSLICFFMEKIIIDSLQNYQSSFTQIDEAQYLYVDVVQVLALSNYQSIIFSTKYHFGSQDEIDVENNIINQLEFSKAREDYRSNFKNLVIKSRQEQIKEKLFDQKFNVTKFTVKFPDSDITSSVMSQNLQYTIMEYFYAIVQYIIQFTSTEDNFIWENLTLFSEKMKNLQKIVEEVIQIQFDNIENIQKQILIIFFATNFILCIIIIVLSLFIERSKENILKLTGSFQPKNLEKYIQIIELSLLKLEVIQEDQNHLNNSKNGSGTLKNKNIQLRNIIEQMEELNDVQEYLSNEASPNNIKQKLQNKFIIRLPNKRNRSIASFNSLQKINWLIVLSGILAFVVLLIQPVLNIIISQPYLKEANTMVNERIFLIDINGYRELLL
ncbi:transmembrane protein, putative (macronuclear) [Tetrahymena thermophila SB210]|uniref:Transmembrane protein, putative n=1 Tax=Tetrahymena thermophila (strain SB210) TaxID=312017 RepID=Q237U2_TETTS|nr:transmembrane protein, putative [Tetrahymena thermophila SB210]EAR92649.3 transmembrane protein, putative [Tetrahymena thermophila SB210]|eukprot:XP_001012894.3 transmembrane protein, putative [Tetrahymena thermophila SB210]